MNHLGVPEGEFGNNCVQVSFLQKLSWSWTEHSHSHWQKRTTNRCLTESARKMQPVNGNSSLNLATQKQMQTKTIGWNKQNIRLLLPTYLLIHNWSSTMKYSWKAMSPKILQLEVTQSLQAPEKLRASQMTHLTLPLNELAQLIPRTDSSTGKSHIRNKTYFHGSITEYPYLLNSRFTSICQLAPAGSFQITLVYFTEDNIFHSAFHHRVNRIL